MANGAMADINSELLFVYCVAINIKRDFDRLFFFFNKAIGSYLEFVREESPTCYTGQILFNTWSSEVKTEIWNRPKVTRIYLLQTWYFPRKSIKCIIKSTRRNDDTKNVDIKWLLMPLKMTLAKPPPNPIFRRTLIVLKTSAVVQPQHQNTWIL